MKLNRLFLVSAALLSSACGASLECSEDNNCFLNEAGTALCESGHQWLDPDAADDYRCEPIPEVKSPVSEFGTNLSLSFELVANSSAGLAIPRDLEFHPDRPDELWIINQETQSMTILHKPNTPDQRSEVRIDAFADHFMAVPSSLAFGALNTFATCQESRNDMRGYQQPDDFMGPTLWPADLDIFAMVNQTPFGNLLGSHLDMNHQSPLCMGIAHQQDNEYWVFDGFNGHVVFYDFNQDHGPGRDDHSDAQIRRYPEASLTRVEGIPGHMEVDHATGWLYVADTGAGRVIRLDTKSGTFNRDLFSWSQNEPLAEFSEYTGAAVETIISDLVNPSGLAISGDTLFISDNATGEIIGYDKNTGIELDRISTPAKSISGLTIGPEGELWFVDMAEEKVFHVSP
ncbi:MAG: hypothetical protein VX834_08150 [Myxococcota bacterium]|nr:hypothetical protein [Myxococcota bacterium]